MYTLIPKKSLRGTKRPLRRKKRGDACRTVDTRPRPRLEPILAMFALPIAVVGPIECGLVRVGVGVGASPPQVHADFECRV